MGKIDRNAPCPCGSKVKTKNCCAVSGRFERKPVMIAFPNAPTGHRNPSCYMAATGDCSEKISREHFISECILKGELSGKVVVKGFSWQVPESEKSLVSSNLTAKVLCERHNNALSPLDVAGNQFVHAVRGVDHALGGKLKTPFDSLHLFNGQDIERWLLKMLFGTLASGNMMLKGTKLSNWTPPIEWIELLLDMREWDSQCGFWIRLAKPVYSADLITVGPLTNDATGEIVGGHFHLTGLEVILPIVTSSTTTGLLRESCFRPERVLFEGDHTNRRLFELMLTWKNKPEGRFIKLTRQKTYDGDSPVWIEGSRPRT